MNAVLTGARIKGATQRDHALSLGGFHARDRIDCLTPIRLSPMNDVQLVHVAAQNGLGNGSLVASGASALRWRPPDGTLGAAVTIANGETKVLTGGGSDTDKYVVVKRTSALSLGASETIQLVDTINNVIGGSNFSAAQSTAGHEKYRAIQFWNRGASNVTNLLAWIDDDFDTDVQIAAETPTAGEIQDVADEDTAPTGLSWSAPVTEGTALNLGTVTPDGSVGLWIERSVDVGEAAHPLATTVIRYRFTYSGTDYYGTLRGCSRVAQAGIAGWYLYWGEDAEPDTEAAHDEFVADVDRLSASPFAATKDLSAVPSTDHYAQLRYGSEYGILSPPLENPLIFRIDGTGEESLTPPSGPTIFQIAPYGEGEVRIKAAYFPTFDALADRADTWAVWITSDGTTPDPTTAATYTVAMAPAQTLLTDPRILDYTTAADYTEGTPIKVLVRTRRTGTPYDPGPPEVPAVPDTDSENVTVESTTAQYCGPSRPLGLASFGRALGIQQAEATIADTTVWIDQAKNIYWLVKAGETQLWADTVLVWNLRYNSGDSAFDGFWTTFAVDYTDVDTTGTAAAVDVISWTVGDKRLGVNVQGQRVMVIDVTNAYIQHNYFDMVTAPASSCQSVPAAIRYQNTCFQVWDITEARYKTAAALNEDGGIRSLVPWLQFATQAECL